MSAAPVSRALEKKEEGDAWSPVFFGWWTALSTTSSPASSPTSLVRRGRDGSGVLVVGGQWQRLGVERDGKEAFFEQLGFRCLICHIPFTPCTPHATNYTFPFCFFKCGQPCSLHPWFYYSHSKSICLLCLLGRIFVLLRAPPRYHIPTPPYLCLLFLGMLLYLFCVPH